MKLIVKIMLAVVCLISTSLFADLKVFTCEPEWMALVTELGGDKVSVFSATTGLQDPHQIQARPSLIANVRNVDLLVCTGSDLEIGWLPILLRRVSNSKIKEGSDGYFIATQFTRILGQPKVIDRSQGDIHASGNPHIQTNPHNILPVAKALNSRMIKLDPENSIYYQQRFDDFSKRWKQALKKWKKMTLPLQHLPIVVHHVSWEYLIDYLKLEQLDMLEDKPGIPPTSGHLSELLANMKQRPAKIIIYAAYQDARPANWLSEKTGIPAVKLPFTIGGTDAANDLFSLYEDTFSRLLTAISINKDAPE